MPLTKNEFAINCGFCGKEHDGKNKMIAGSSPNLYICEDCVKESYRLLTDKEYAQAQVLESQKYAEAQEIKDMIDNIEEKLEALKIMDNFSLIKQKILEYNEKWGFDEDAWERAKESVKNRKD